MLLTQEIFDKDECWRVLGVKGRHLPTSTNTEHLKVEVKNMPIMSSNKLLYKIYSLEFCVIAYYY
jgi:hypothetical protein